MERLPKYIEVPTEHLNADAKRHLLELVNAQPRKTEVEAEVYLGAYAGAMIEEYVFKNNRRTA